MPSYGFPTLQENPPTSSGSQPREEPRTESLRKTPLKGTLHDF